MTDYAKWLRNLAFSYENDCPVKPCHKALRRAADEIEQLTYALLAALEWSESIEQGPFGGKRPDIARVEFHSLAKGLVECGHLVNLGYLAKSESTKDTS